MLQWFFRLNRAACDWIEDRLPAAFTRSFNRLYEAIVATEMNRLPGRSVLDIGGGKQCFIAAFRDPDRNPTIVALDIAEAELRLNAQVEDRVVGDATKGLPFADASFDIITSRSLLEHLSDTAGFFRNAQAVLRPGGSFIHLCPGKFAPFALCNQLLPDRLAQRLLYFFQPDFRAECGFKAYYDGTHYEGIRRRLEQAGFTDIRIHLRYYQSIYFDFFVPLYLVSLAWDLAAWALGARNLASQLIVVAQKPAAEAAPAAPEREHAQAAAPGSHEAKPISSVRSE